MTATAPTLFDLFGEPGALWPSDHVRQHTGYASDPGDPAAWLARLNSSVLLANVRTGARADRVAVEADVSVDPTVGFAGDPDGWPFVIYSMPDVEFRICPFRLTGRSAKLLASVGDDGFDLVLEALPVEIRLPGGLLGPHPDKQGAPDGSLVEETGTFEPGNIDDLKIVLRRGEPTSVFVHIRLEMTPAFEFNIQPAVPVSFGRCQLSGIPCRAVHDFRLIPAPAVAPDNIEWLRHPVEPLASKLTGPYDGLFMVRSVDVDENAESMRSVVEWLNGHAKDWKPTAELVLDDVVVPFFSPFLLPFPVHLTAGIRRRILDVSNPSQVYTFEEDPVHIHLHEDPFLALNISSFFYRSTPYAELDNRFLPSKPEFPTAEGWDDPGLTFDASLVVREEQSPPLKDGKRGDLPQHALRFGVEEEMTVVLGYRRDWGSDGLPGPDTGALGFLNRLLHWEIAQLVIVDIMGFKVGFSPAHKFGNDESLVDSSVLTADLFVSMPPTGSGRKWLALRGLNGEPVKFPLEGVGWRLGEKAFGGLALPDGVVAYIYKFALVISELGLRAEDGGSYLSFSGGLLICPPSGFELMVTVKGLRFLVAGSENLPGVKLDGFFLRARNSIGTVKIEGGGYYRELDVNGSEIAELGFALGATLKLAQTYEFGIEGIIGSVSTSNESFDYLMFQATFRGSVKVYGFEFTGARALYARNMIPQLRDVDRDARELRYLKWYKETNPLTVPPDRRLAGWRPETDSWALGVGASVSLPGLGKCVELTVFTLVQRGPVEQGVFCVAEVFALHRPRPFGYAVVEVDSHNDRVCVVIGVDIRVGSFVENAPSWMDDIGAVTGTLFISNDPGTFAIGRLADATTWAGLRFDVDLWLETSLLIGFCVEIVEDGPKGFGLTARIEGGIGKRGVVRLSYDAGFTLLVGVFTTGSTDAALVFSIGAGIRFTLFGFLRIGVSTQMAFRIVGNHPTRGELTAEIRLETPWFLPDVTWRLDAVFGDLRPGDLSSAVQPLRSAAANELGGTQRGVHLERFDPAWNGQGVAPVHSVNELRAPTRPEAVRIANFAAAVDAEAVATDATIAISFAVAINDRLGLGTGMADGLGSQSAGDLSLTYDLVGIAVRRRPRFGLDRTWRPLEEKIELDVSFAGPAGPQLDGTFAPQVLNKTWDVDVKVAGEAAPKRLLLNSAAPYEFTIGNELGDEQLVGHHPGWPCCTTFDDKDLAGLYHRIGWRTRVPGETLDAPAVGRFTDSNSALRFLRPAWVRPATFTGLPSPVTVAAAEPGLPGVIARANFDEDVALCSIRLAVPRTLRATLVLFDGGGKEVGREELASTVAFQAVTLSGQGPIRQLELWVVQSAAGAEPQAMASAPAGAALEIDEIAYIGLRDYVGILIAEAACAGGGGGLGGGAGKLAFLPNYEYEVALTTRVSIEHPSKPAVDADVEEFVYFRTKGLPGLNAVSRVGEELDPYVRGAYTGGRASRIYREEPVTLTFSEDFFVAVPLTARPPGAAAEQSKLLQMQLVVAPERAAASQTQYTVTSDDWIVAHRGGVPPTRGDRTWDPVLSNADTRSSAMRSVDPMKLRLATMTQRPAVTCNPADPSLTTGTVLVAPPVGVADPASPGAQLWDPDTWYTAQVRAERAPFVDRRPFEPRDERALSLSRLGAGGTPQWAVQDGSLQRGDTGWGLAQFGEPTWNHVTVLAGVVPGAASAGIGVGVGADTGLFALVEAQGTTARLVIRRREAGGPLVEMASADIAAVGADSVPLEVTAFDDRLRARVAEAVIEADRGENRDGRLCLISDGPAAFASLQVRGLDMYAFRFGTSRFRSFEEHVGSWSGRVEEIGPDTLGVGTTTTTVAQLWSDTSAAATAAMAPSALSADRERVFSAWAAGLGLALNDSVKSFGISRYVEAATTRALLLESPEPLDFTEEITVGLVARRRGMGPGHPPHPNPPNPFPRPLRDRFADLLDPPRRPVGPTAGRPSVDETILDVEMSDGGLRLSLHPALANANALAAVTVAADGSATLYRGTVRPPLLRGRPAIMQATEVGAIGHLPAGSELSVELSNALPGTVLLASDDLLDLIGRWFGRPIEIDVPVDVRVIASGDGCRALVIPLTGGAATGLQPGPHRLSLALKRSRWQTTEAPDSLNTYQGSAAVALDL